MKQVAALLVALALSTGCPSEEPPVPEPDPDAREACADTDPLRRAFFGDLHVHSAWSYDAWVQDVRGTPEDAYRFARGEEVLLPPLDAEGEGTRSVRLTRPLDFVGVTDHGELLGEVQACLDPDSGAWDSSVCTTYREAGDNATVVMGAPLSSPSPERLDELCGEGAADCRAYTRDAWTRMQEIAEQYYDRTPACSFTSFVGYEWSGTPELSNIHRNVIFRGTVVPELPLSYFEAPTGVELWSSLRRECLDVPWCDVLAIPHNPNLSNGRMFELAYSLGADADQQRAEASERALLEPIVEVYQHKGDSECKAGFNDPLSGTDEACAFEKMRPLSNADCGFGTGSGGMGNIGCISYRDFLRGALADGLREEERLGVNPYRMGVIGSTDTHNATPGAVEERGWPGHVGRNEQDAPSRLQATALLPGGIRASPGGLAGVWAEENSRDALFDAMQRREVFGTSGPRIVPRFFGGWDLPEGLCEQPDMIEAAYAGGVPMGSVMPPGAGTSPRFLVAAQRDAGTEQFPGMPLQRLQVVKGWLEASGQTRIEVFDVAGDPDNGASVDTSTCAPQGEGFDSLCAVWEDPDYSAEQRAFYYLRVLENPSCRWSTWQCLEIPEEDRPEGCSDASVPKTIQERAWTSPIWISP